MHAVFDERVVTFPGEAEEAREDIGNMIPKIARREFRAAGLHEIFPVLAVDHDHTFPTRAARGLNHKGLVPTQHLIDLVRVVRGAHDAIGLGDVHAVLLGEGFRAELVVH